MHRGTLLLLLLCLGLAGSISWYLTRPVEPVDDGLPPLAPAPPFKLPDVHATEETRPFAPDFSLPRLDGKGEMRLSSFREDRSVLLLFGSFT